MISTPHRQTAISLIDEAVIAGARRAKACAELEISPLCQGSCPLLYFSLIFRWAG